ncbi:hypothetical protein ACFWD7_17855 [Streptomyces mirabilis]|uniref:hypothetical protein n=1 Tax=Streptomyces mirabilis TaxID=68239 RepID=UPI0021BF8BFF|nr:hypothetical protein [Streptomyces mirabilis]MCT9110774.1 hypothetical protein [Streptomyces mirabilis]
MGSMRNPVGPLPSTIYWRRRAVLLSLVALLALLIAWVVSSGGGGGKKNADGSNGKSPVQTITPGPSGSGPAISQHPGGRDESSPGTSAGTASGSSGSGSGSGSGDGSGGTGSADGGGSDGGGADGGSSGGTSSGDQVPAGSTLPNCTAGAVKLTLRSVHNTYAPGDKPSIEMIAKNSSASDCKVDLGPKSAVLTITQAGGDKSFWSSSDCPKDAASLFFRVPAGDQVTYTVDWDRAASAAQCATPPAGSATAGTYLVEAKAPGLAKATTSFVLSQD